MFCSKRFRMAAMVGLCFAVLVAAVGSFSARCAEVRNEVVRLHILANSDSESDQALKLAVRDKLLQESSLWLTDADTAQAAVAALEESLPEIQALAEEVVAAAGEDYGVSVEISTDYFTTRTYGDCTLPAGEYTALQVKLGEAQGHNWWCVLYPPLCLSAAAVEDFDNDTADLVTRDPNIEVRFAVVELLTSLANKLTKGHQ